MISVCIPTYNGSKYIKEQLDSILRQLSNDDEIIISDDNSTDNTLDIVRAIGDPRIEIHTHPAEPNSYKGIFRTIYLINRNMQNALRYAKGDYIFMADQDDIWIEGKVERMVAELQTADCVIHNCVVVDDDKNILLDSFYNYIPPKTTFIGTLIRSSFMGCCMAFNRKVLEKALPFPKLALEHDTWIGLSAIKIGRVVAIDDKLLSYRRHGFNVSSCGEGSKNPLLTKSKRRFVMLWAYLTK